MKKILSCILALSMTVGLCACGQLEKLENIELPPLPTQTAAPVPVQTPEPSAEPSFSIVRQESGNQIIINTVTTSLEEYDPAEGKELILSFSYETPVVYIEGKDDVSKKINDAIALMDETHYTGNDHGMGVGTGGFNMMLEQAQDNYGYVINSGVQGLSLEFTASRTADISRADSSVISIVYDDYYYTGGAHGIYFSRGYNFDAQTGEKITLDQLSKNSEKFKSLLVDAMVSMAKSDENISGRIDVSSTVNYSAAETFSKLLRDGSWYFTNEGLRVFSDVYELGTYAQGEVVFDIPYEKLAGEINEKYLPEVRSGKAELTIAYLSDVKDGSFEIIDRVVVHEEGQELCIGINGTAYDVNLVSVDYVDRIFETQQHWYANFVKNSALQILCTVPEGMPNLMLSYFDSDGNNHRMLISQSGENGNLLLVDDSIQAVG